MHRPVYIVHSSFTEGSHITRNTASRVFGSANFFKARVDVPEKKIGRDKHSSLFSDEAKVFNILDTRKM